VFCCGQIMQLHRSAKGPGSHTQSIPFGPSPCAPLDDHGETKREQFLRELPLQRFDSCPLFFVPQVDCKSINPLIRSEPNPVESVFQHLCDRCLTRTGQAAHNDQSWTGTFHNVETCIRTSTHREVRMAQT